MSSGTSEAAGETVRHAKSFPVSWEELHRHSKALAWRLLELGPWQGIIAITRGGMVPAAILARELELRFVDTLCGASYTDRVAGEVVKSGVKVLKPIAGDGDGFLIIDDL